MTGLWLHPVGVHRTRLVMIPEDLDLSGIDRTLGGSVRSLPPVPVDPKDKATKKTTTKKRKYLDVETSREAIVAEAVERAERGGAHSGVWIADQLSPEAMATLE